MHVRASTSRTDAHAAARFEALGVRSPVWIQRTACLRLRTRHASCRACAEACPTRSLQASTQGLELGDACTGCGRCQAVCPTGALAVEGFAALPLAPRAGDAPLTIDCRQVPATLADGGQIRVPCLGGLSAASLLTLCANAQARPVVLIDRGVCRSCTSGDSVHPARAMLKSVVSLMTQAGVPEARLPRLVRMPMSGPPARHGAVDPSPAVDRSRRRFLTAMARPAGDAPARKSAPPQGRASTPRAQTLAALQTLAARHGGRVSASLFHRLEVGAACRGHRVCASACPTGALLRYGDDDAGRVGLTFDNAACIGCGHCASVCPEQALHLRRGAGDLARGPRPLTAFVQRECAECGGRFTLRDNEHETRCGRCRTSARLARSAFRALFGART